MPGCDWHNNKKNIFENIYRFGGSEREIKNAYIIITDENISTNFLDEWLQQNVFYKVNYTIRVLLEFSFWIETPPKK